MKRLLLCALLGSACHHAVPPPTVVRIVETQEVKVPVLVPVVPVPPVALFAPLTSPLPVFVAPSDPAASSALTADGERALRAFLNDLLARIAAWQAWAVDPPKPPDKPASR